MVEVLVINHRVFTPGKGRVCLYKFIHRTLRHDSKGYYVVYKGKHIDIECGENYWQASNLSQEYWKRVYDKTVEAI